ncbi:class I SAM-dependent methyltransferase [Ornithinibacillus massiliensis]|uniref:Class I SAM-dependent methyltransferase n=1 Tax=Ornithinibacillus massiliensis TaxID=1944633 RepID=A0ABS5MDH3_9BACI|nr:class I SAM-dependent methyltransferase [Ornithinibacillus massiliensis]MBS3680376.1 class I SAM-dependent methyltransferase [Ornithinibacillus massiliensis]
MKKEKLIKKYDSQVSMYENNRNNPTVAGWREKLIKSAYGKVLEVGVGVGANFPHYDKQKVSEIIGVDFSKEMIKSAEQQAITNQLHVHFIHQDVDTLSLQSNSFNSIVSTLTLCSYPDPVKTLNKYNDWCQEDGAVLFLEHGLSSNILLSMTQKVVDPLYRRFSGCHCDRDILKIMEASKLQVKHFEQYWSGMVSLIWAKPNK